jgi:hypothetical protein
MLISILLLIVALSLPKLVESRKHSNEASAIGALKAIASAESRFREGDAEQDGNLDYGMLSELAATGLIDAEVGTGTKAGYRFSANYSFTTSEFLWFGSTAPTRAGMTGDRSFVTNQAGLIYYTTGLAPTLDTLSCDLAAGRQLVPT